MDEQQLETAWSLLSALYCSAVPIVQWSTNKSLARQMIWRKLMRSSALNCIYLTSQLRNQIEPTILKVVFIFISQIEIKYL